MVATDKRVLAYEIADSLREKILSGELEQGSRITEASIAQAFGASRTPVREALRQLEAEQLITIAPYKGAVVSKITDKDIRNYYELHGLLISYAAAKVAKKISESAIEGLEKLLEKLRTQFEAKYYTGMVHTHTALFDSFMKFCGNDKLLNTLKAVNTPFQRFRVIMSQAESLEDSLHFYEEIIDAFKKRDSRKAAFHAAKFSGETGVAIRRKVEQMAEKSKTRKNGHK